MEERYVRIGVGVLILKEGKVLFGKRIGAHGADSWAPPGGHLEINESLFDCAQREVLEETGLEVQNLRKASSYTEEIFDENKNKRIDYAGRR